MKNNLFTLDSELFFWTLRKLLAFTRKGSSIARERDTLPSFSHCSQSRITWREIIKESGGRGPRVLRTRPTKRIMYKTLESKVTALLPLLSPDSPSSPPSDSPPLFVLFSWMPSMPVLLGRPRTRAGITKGRRERRRQMTRRSCSLDRSHVTSSETSWTRFILSSLSESLSDIPSLCLPCRPLPSLGLSLNPSRDETSHFTSLPAFNLPRVACSRPPFLSVMPRRRYVEYANKSCTNVPEIWTHLPINYSVGAVKPSVSFRTVPLSSFSPLLLVRLSRAFI